MEPGLKVSYSMTTRLIHRVKWRHSNLWSHYDLYVLGQHGVLCEVKWWRLVALLEWNWIGWFMKISVLSLSY